MNSELIRRGAPALVVVAAALVYLNALGNVFAYDDVHIIQQNVRVHQLSDLRSILLTPYWPHFGQELGLYRPFIILLYALQWAIGGGAAWVFHAGSIVLHAGASLLGFLLLQRLTSTIPALVGALIFAVHPVHVEAVANIVGQAELVVAIALLGACLLHATRPAGVEVSWPRRVGLVALFAMGLATKESAVVLPGLLVVLDFAQRRIPLTARGCTTYARAMGMPVFLLAATVALYLIVRFDVMSGAMLGLDAAPALPYLREEHRILNALRAFPEFIRLLVFPQDLSADYTPGVILPVSSLTPMALLGALLMLSLTLLALATPWWPAAGLAAAWFIICISPVANVFFPIGVLVAERTLYAPSFALSLALAFGWFAAAARVSIPMRRLAPALLLIALVLLGARTWVRNPDWHSTPTILASLYRDHPESYRAQWMRAATLWQLGHRAEADDHWTLAYRVYPRDSQFLQEYGIYLMATGRLDEGVALIEESYALHPYVPRTVTMLAHAMLVVGRHEEALPLIEKAEYYGARRGTSMPLRAYAYHGLGDLDRAVAAWRVTLDHATSNRWVVYAFLGRSLALAGYRGEASAAADSARRAIADLSVPPAPDSARTVQAAARAHETLDAFAGALEAGCYDADHGRAASARLAGPAFPACDPLGDWFVFTGQAQVAILLHNANKSVQSAPPAGLSRDQ